MALSDFTTGPLKAPYPDKIAYGAKQRLEKTEKETTTQSIKSNFVMSSIVSACFIGATGLFAVASGAGLSVIPFIVAALIAPPALTILSPIVNSIISGKDSDRDPRVYLKNQQSLGNLKGLSVPDDISTDFLRRPSPTTIIAGAAAGLVIGAISFAFPIAPAAAAAAMFGTALLSATLGAAYSAIVPSTTARLDFEKKVIEKLEKESNAPAPKGKAEDRIKEAAADIIEIERDSQKLAHEEIKSGFSANSSIEKILSRGPKTDFVSKILEQKNEVKSAEKA